MLYCWQSFFPGKCISEELSGFASELGLVDRLPPVKGKNNRVMSDEEDREIAIILDRQQAIISRCLMAGKFVMKKLLEAIHFQRGIKFDSLS